MNKYIIGGLIAVALVAFGVFSFGTSNVSYIADITDEINQLEEELVALDMAVSSGELTPDEAEEARARIAARLEAINTSASSADESSLTEEQKQQLLDALERLKQTLVQYSATLVTVDEQAKKSTKRGGRSGGNRSLIDVLTDTVDSLEEHVEEVIEEYEPEEEMEDNMEENEEGSEDAESEGDETEEDTSDDEGAEEMNDEESSDNSDNGEEDANSEESETEEEASEAGADTEEDPQQQ